MFSLPQKILLPIQQVSGHLLLVLSYRGKVMQFKALKSKHEHNGSEAPDAFISSKLVVVKQPREHAGFPLSIVFIPGEGRQKSVLLHGEYNQSFCKEPVMELPR